MRLEDLSINQLKALFTRYGTGRRPSGVVAFLIGPLGLRGYAFCCSSTGDAGRRDEGPLNGGQGDKVRVCLEIQPFPLVLDGEVGAAAGDLATGLGLSPALTLLAGLVHHLVSSHSLLSVVFCIYSSSPSSG